MPKCATAACKYPAMRRFRHCFTCHDRIKAAEMKRRLASNPPKVPRQSRARARPPLGKKERARLQRERYWKRRIVGLCVRCTKLAVEGHSTCKKCLEKERKRSKRRVRGAK